MKLNTAHDCCVALRPPASDTTISTRRKSQKFRGEPCLALPSPSRTHRTVVDTRPFSLFRPSASERAQVLNVQYNLRRALLLPGLPPLVPGHKGEKFSLSHCLLLCFYLLHALADRNMCHRCPSSALRPLRREEYPLHLITGSGSLPLHRKGMPALHQPDAGGMLQTPAAR
ncbi:hypothetical protein K402DRAFT_269182 [Aulographum hederae CBS 113979]|uniref:Uncharacterized protein n=1 Tax=Aulographum hederae CBS 113979 TaxID=1176131 RepID=A0A6G1H8L4_9PEZI|nr:hypothetical protein K402DRAFT_269182 [Aulographum hederae CBS 113979]